MANSRLMGFVYLGGSIDCIYANTSAKCLYTSAVSVVSFTVKILLSIKNLPKSPRPKPV